MNRLPGIRRWPRAYAALYPVAFAALDLRGYDLVISLTSSFAKGIRTDAEALHLCYCHSPSNFVWRETAYFSRRRYRLLSAPLRAWLKAWERWAARRPDIYVANSELVAQRIRAFYRRDAVVIPPPVAHSWFAAHRATEFLLVVSRLVPHKRIDVAIEASHQTDLPLWIVGAGRSAGHLRQLAGRNVRFLGQVSDADLRNLYQRAVAVLVPGEEDFGIVPVEAQAAGTPAIAYDAGGARETVIDGVTGIRFAPQTPAALADAIARLRQRPWDRQVIQANAAQFGEDNFRRALTAVIDGWRSLAVPSGGLGVDIRSDRLQSVPARQP